MHFISIWISGHHQTIVAIIALALWVMAQYWYFRVDISRIRRERRAHNWSVDLAAKTGKGGKTNMH